jgi:trimeric autotransporter adhesin
MSRMLMRWVTVFVLLGVGITPRAQSTYPSATVTISGVQTGTASGTMTIAFDGHTHTVSYGQFSTASSIASAFAAEFSSYPASAWPRLCTIGVCAKANGATITFQLSGSASFGVITVTSTPTSGTNPFGATVSMPSSISLTSSANPSTFEAPVTFTSTLPNGATGSVTFYDGTNSSGSGTISGTTAHYTSSSLAVGTHSVTAIYSGDGTYSGSASGVVTQVVNKAIPTVTVATSGTPTSRGVSITFTATVSSLPTSVPTGTVTFYDGSTVIGTGQISGTTATMTTSVLAAGTHIITANYAGDTHFAAATSGAIDQVVTAIAIPGSGIIITVAGSGTCGYSGDGGAATSAKLCSPSAVAVDASGNIYIADTGYGYIRKVNTTTGFISTVAGNGAPYSSSGPATSTGVGIALGIAVDASGNIYIADSSDSRVLKVNAATGVMNSIAGTGTAGYSGDGGPATSAYLDAPAGLSLDTGGNLYIASSGDSRIRKVNPAGTISTVAGTGTAGYSGDGGAATSAELNLPEGVYVDASGNIYIADWENNRIRKVNTAGIITTVAGTGTAGYSGDGGAATSASLNLPQGVYVDASGDIYIADGANNRIRKVNGTTQTITTVAGNGTAGYSGDGGIATSAELNFSGFGMGSVYVNAAGTIYISDNDNNRIRAVGPVANALGITIATSGSPSVYGSPVTFTAAVPSGDTNTVTFYSGSNPLGTATPGNGIASLTISSLAAGVNPITASIAAGGSYPAATSDIIDQIVNPLTSTISISNIPSNAGYGGSFTATYSYSGNGSPSVSSSTPSVCAASDSNVYYLGIGTCTLQANAPATAAYAAATGSAQSFTVSPPTVASLSPTSGPESTPVTISGRGFGLSPKTTTVAFNGTVANISSWSNTAIVAEVPIGATTGNVVVTAGGTASNGVMFTVQATTPTIVSLSASSGNAGLAVTIIGSGFGLTEGQSTVTFNGYAAGVLNWNDSSITAIVPSKATTGPVVVKTLPNNQTSNTNIIFTVAGSASCPL